MNANLIAIETLTDTLVFDSRTLALSSFRSKSEPEQEFIAFDQQNPVFVIGYLDSQRQYRWLDSTQVEHIQILQNKSRNRQQLQAVYSKIGGFDLEIGLSVQASEDDRFSYWRISLENRAGLEIVDVQYPFVICRYDLQGSEGSEAIVLPHGYGSGRLIERPGKAISAANAWKKKLGADCWREWEFTSRLGDGNHYPGMQFAQFLAYYNDRAGLYLACNDRSANVKRFAALHHEPGFRLGVAHVGDWPSSGKRELEYEVLLGSFSGNWYAAAKLYREWSLRQEWFVPLTKRKDVPAWLLDSPVYITVRPQGMLDEGPDVPMDDLLPLDEKSIPLLEKISQKVQAPLAVILMGWERAGSWVYPDSFPPVGGEASMRTFFQAIRQRGWRAGSFCNGTRWVTGQSWNSYDGRDYFDEKNGIESVCREADGSAWKENWDASWRPSYACCLGAEKTRKTALEFVGHLVGWGMESLQFLDQNNGSSTFPCFASDHGHPPLPGKWMAENMVQFMQSLNQLALEMGETQVVHSAESGLNETCLPYFQETELRTFPPGYETETIPLYQYLFHECVVLQGMMGNAPEPYHLVIRNAVNCVWGGIPGGVMTGFGTLLDKDTNNWADWEPRIENSENAFAMIKAVTALRRGPGRDYLVFGRMLRPVEVTRLEMIEWTYNRQIHRIPAIFHAAWQAPGGAAGVVLANWTAENQTICFIRPPGQLSSSDLTLHISAGELISSRISFDDLDEITIVLPPLSCALVEDR